MQSWLPIRHRLSPRDTAVWRRAARWWLLALLGAGPLAAQTVRGKVSDRATGEPVSGGLVRLITSLRAAVARATTDEQGAFELVAPGPGSYRVQFERPGYRLLITPLFDLRPGEAIDYALQVNSLPPFALDTAVVEGQAVPRRMLGFYQRRARGVGTFLTRQEFERWHPQMATDIVRHAQVFDITLNPFYGANGDFREYIVESRRGAHQPFGECSPLIYLDDTRLGTAGEVNLDDILAVGAIEALEFYEGGTQVPIEYQSNGSNCGVIAIWSRLESGGPVTTPHGVEIGAQVGGHVAEGRVQEGRVGVQASIGLASVFEFYPAFNKLVQDWAGGAVPRSGWQVLVSLRARPLGVESPWYAGAGFTTINVEEGSSADPTFRTSSSKDYLVVLAGLRVPLPYARPIIEMQLLDLTHPGRAQVLVFTGLAVRLR